MRTDEHGRKLLGTLFAEGGLPWKLVQDESHGFGRAIGGGLAFYQRSGATGQSIVGYLERYGAYLPRTFDNAETFDRLAAIVTELSRLAGRYPELSGEADAVAYLDRREPGWRARFPIPLGERSGRALVASWLVRAVREKTRSEHDAATRGASAIGCTTWLDAPALDAIRSSLSLPGALSFETDVDALRSTRFTPVVYEGDRSVLTLAACYGKIDRDDEGKPTGTVRLRLEPGTRDVPRSRIDRPLSLRILVDDQRVATLPVDHDEADVEALPLIFEGSDVDGWRWAGCVSADVPSATARLYLPAATSLRDDAAHDVLGTDAAGGAWLDLHESATIVTSAGPVRVAVGSSARRPRPEIVGRLDNRATDPIRCYLGFPDIQLPHDPDAPASDIEIHVNGRPLGRLLRSSFVGVAHLSISTPEHGLLMRRRFGVLPADLRIGLVPASQSRPATLTVKTQSKARVEADCSGADIETIPGPSGHGFGLRRRGADETSEVRLRLAGGERTEPVVVRLPWPGAPARLLGPDGRTTDRRHFGVDALLGLRLVLSRPGAFKERFHLGFTLEGRHGRNLELHRQLEVDQVPLELSLEAYRDEFLRMLSARSDQDDRICVRIETDRLHLQFHVSRFETYLERDRAGGTFALVDFGRQPRTGAGELWVTDLTRPEVERTVMPERLSEGVGTGVYELPDVPGTGPWIVHAGRAGGITVRPGFVAGTGAAGVDDYPTPLHRACALFHPVHRPDAIDEVVAEMAGDFDHAGWDCLRSIRKSHDGLPLSSFEAWRSVARSDDALVATFLKLELDAELASRVSSELAVIWETIPLRTWFDRVDDFARYLGDKLQDEELAGDVVRSLLRRLSTTVPLLESCVDLKKAVMKAPWNPGVAYQGFVRDQYQQLRRRQPENGLWPRSLEKRLRAWYRVQDALPRFDVLDGGQPEEVLPVCLLPPFLACVAAGRASIGTLDDDLAAARFDVRALAEFDRDWFEPAYGVAAGYLYHAAKD